MEDGGIVYGIWSRRWSTLPPGTHSGIPIKVWQRECNLICGQSPSFLAVVQRGLRSFLNIDSPVDHWQTIADAKQIDAVSHFFPASSS